MAWAQHAMCELALGVRQPVKKISTFYGNQKFDHSVHNSVPVVPVPIQMKPVTSTNCIF